MCVDRRREFPSADADAKTRGRRVSLKVVDTPDAITHVAPVHFPADFPPFTMSQYDPFGREVVNVAVQVFPALLIAT